MKKVLLIAGAGTLGNPTAEELINLGYDVTVIALNDMVSLNKHYHFIKATVTDDLLKSLFAENRFDAIVDFIHYGDPVKYKPRGDLLLANTDQLIFLSSYRVYANEEPVITENSPQILDVISKTDENGTVALDGTYGGLDKSFILGKETYAIPKSFNERFLRSKEKKNWTVIRPLITFSHYRLDLITEGAGDLLLQAREGGTLLLPLGAKRNTAGVGHCSNLGKMIAHLIGKQDALGEAFTLGTGEPHLWEDVAGYYADLLGLDMMWVPDADYIAAKQNFDPFIYPLDRAWNRKIDNSKMFRVTGLTKADFLPTRAGIVKELAYFAEHPEKVEKFFNPGVRAVCDRMNAYAKEHR